MAQAPIVLKAADVVAAARKAYEEGRLSAQGPTPACKYRDDSGLPCAVGVAFSDGDARRFIGPIGCLVTAGRVEADDPGALDALQAAHDNWSTCRRWIARGDEAVGADRDDENHFRALIGLDPLPVEG